MYDIRILTVGYYLLIIYSSILISVVTDLLPCKIVLNQIQINTQL